MIGSGKHAIKLTSDLDSCQAIGKNCQYHISWMIWEFSMPTRNINLTAEQDAFVEEMVKAGKYQNASEAMRDALRSLELRVRADDLKLELLRTQIKAGIEAINQGAFAEIDDADLDAALDDLASPKMS
jgi:antitoxin ParD1/3/4